MNNDSLGNDNSGQHDLPAAADRFDGILRNFWRIIAKQCVRWDVDLVRQDRTAFVRACQAHRLAGHCVCKQLGTVDLHGEEAGGADVDE